MEEFDLVIIGGGPVGLAAAIEAKRYKLNYVILEKGVLTNSIYNFPKFMRFFTTAALLEIGGHAFPSTDVKPTRQMALDYYRRVTELEELRFKLFHEVIKLEVQMGEFVLNGYNRRYDEKTKFTFKSKFVIVSTGYYDNPNGLGGIPGEDSPHVSYYYDEPHKYFDLDVVIIGAGNSGAETSLELYRHGARVTLLHKHSELKSSLKYWVGPDLKNRIKNNEIIAKMSAEVIKITRNKVFFKQNGQTKFADADAVFIFTGFTPNVALFETWGVNHNSDDLTLKLKPNFESERSNLYFLGSAGQGRNTNSVFIENGREHAILAVKSIKSKMNF